MLDRRSEFPSRDRFPLDTNAGEPAPGVADPAPLVDGISPAHLIRSVRENLPLFVIVAGIALSATALLLWQADPQYSARSVIRMAGERRSLANAVESAPPTLDRPVDPLLSAVQVLTSRKLVGAVSQSRLCGM
jgi:uncharacterized protein involved in exopolysaccharide biosynthesis